MTLTELLVVLALLALALPVLSFFLREGFAVFDRTSSEAAAQLEVRHKIEVLKTDIRTSKTHAAGGEQYPAADGPSLQLFTGTVSQPAYVVYILEDGQLYRQATGEPRKLFLHGVVKFQPEVAADSGLVSVQIAVAFTSERHQEPFQKQFSVKVLPRGGKG
jgi:type II secretory pathway pseudopilin PulG